MFSVAITMGDANGETFLVPAALDFESYTDAVEGITKLLGKRAQSATVALRLTARTGTNVIPPPRTPEALLRWEKALGMMQQASQLLVAVIDGPIDNLMLSLALACDVRVCTPTTTYTPSLDGASLSCALIPTWWLASLAYHTGAMRAAQLLTCSTPAAATDLLQCGLLRKVVEPSSIGEYAASVTPSSGTIGPRGKAVQLLRRILLQSFSLHNADCTGHALAANSLLISEALEALHSSPQAPLAPLRPLGFELSESEAATGRWELQLAAELEDVAIEELLTCVGSLSRKLEHHLSAGKPLPSHLLLRLRVSAERQARPLIPAQLLHEQSQPTDDRILRWLTRWEKVIASLATLPLPTVAHLACEGESGTATLAALQLAFACDLRVASPGVHLAFCSGSLLPGTLPFKLAKHVGAGALRLARPNPLRLRSLCCPRTAPMASHHRPRHGAALHP